MEVLCLLDQLIKPFSASFFLVAITFLFLRGREVRSRRILSYTMLPWAVYFVTCVVTWVLKVRNPFDVTTYLFDPSYMLGANFYTLISCLYPIEVILPGWLNLRRFGWAMLGYGVFSGFFRGMVALLGEEIVRATTYEELWANFGQFNVWFRGVILLFLLVNAMLLLRFIYCHERRYEKWANDHYADTQFMDVGWMRSYGWMILLLSLVYLVILTTGEKWVFLLHNVIALFFFCLVVYRALFQKSPYPEGFFADSSDQQSAATRLDIQYPVLPEEKMDKLTADSFVSKEQMYIERFKKWMDEEQPYLYQDFKLTDVARVLPMNRSYLSRIFNEGMGKSFSEVVRGYRLAYAKKMLVERPNLSIQRVASVSGFSSLSVFGRTFAQQEKMTPKQYREQYFEKHP